MCHFRAGSFPWLGLMIASLLLPSGVNAATAPQPADRRYTALAKLPSASSIAGAGFRTFAHRAGGEGRYRSGVVLVRFFGQHQPQAMLVEPGSEPAARDELLRRDDVVYAELDVVLTRQFVPNDPGFPSQWHHAKIGSTSAWGLTRGDNSVTLAIVDTPFQMDHPDLAAHTIAGWSMVENRPITGDPVGYYHSTIGAGMAAAVINNQTGVSGVVNCKLMPIDIGDSPTASDMHNAIVWAADHGVRVVNLSWDGAFSSVINDAGAYLKEKTRGMLFMSGVNGDGRLDYPNQPNIYAVSMTDTNDVARSAWGPHIDFAAPGFQIYSTTTNGGYEVDTGTSYSSPLLAGIAAWIMSVNPALGPDEIEGILRNSCVDLGTAGWDEHYGWGRIDFSRVAQRTFETLPVSDVRALPGPPFTVSAQYVPGLSYTLMRTEEIASGQWQALSNAILTTNGASLLISDPGTSLPHAFYRLQVSFPY